MRRYDRPLHWVFMTFIYRAGWHVRFLEADLRVPLPRGEPADVWNTGLTSAGVEHTCDRRPSNMRSLKNAKRRLAQDDGLSDFVLAD